MAEPEPALVTAVLGAGPPQNARPLIVDETIIAGALPDAALPPSFVTETAAAATPVPPLPIVGPPENVAPAIVDRTIIDGALPDAAQPPGFFAEAAPVAAPQPPAAPPVAEPEFVIPGVSVADLRRLLALARREGIVGPSDAAAPASPPPAPAPETAPARQSA